MHELFWEVQSDESGYNSLLSVAAEIAKSIVVGDRPPASRQQALFIYEESEKLVNAVSKKNSTFLSMRSQLSKNIGIEGLTLLGEHWKSIASGNMHGEDIIRRYPFFWRRLMSEWPMNEYAKLAANVFIENRLFSKKRILEIGAGVGVTSKMIAPHIVHQYIRTDIKPEICAMRNLPGEVRAYDFDQPTTFADIDLILGVNALHCAKNKAKTLSYLWGALKNGGSLIFAEGAPYTFEGIPWALTGFFGLFNGWWDRGGFLSRETWLQLLDDAGFSQTHFCRLTAGRHDLGGLFWAKK